LIGVLSLDTGRRAGGFAFNRLFHAKDLQHNSPVKNTVLCEERSCFAPIISAKQQSQNNKYKGLEAKTACFFDPVTPYIHTVLYIA
jgi:hypothetical protein